MKRMKFALLICIAFAAHMSGLSAQQSLTYTLDNGTIGFNNPAQPGAFTLSSPISIKVLSTDLSKLQQVEFLDAASAPKASLSLADLGVARGANSVVIVINTDGSIAAKPTVKAPFPMELRFTYNGVVQPATQLIGQAGPINPGGGPQNPPMQAPVSGITHIAYYDALQIASFINGQQGKSLISFMNQSGYFPNVAINTLADLQAAAQQNRFLAAVFGPLNNQRMNLAAGQAGFSPLSPSGIAGASVTNFADGLAKFLVGRFKQELSLAFFTKFQKDLNDPRFADLKILFPQTWKTLQTIGQDIYQFSGYLNSLRSAFIQDLTNAYTDIKNLLQQQKYKDWFNTQHPELGTILYTSLYLIDNFSAGRHPGAVLAGFSDQTYIHLCNACTPEQTALQTNVRSAVRTLKLLSASIRSLSTSTYWVPADSIRQLTNDAMTFKLYLGLLYQVAHNQSGDASTVISFSTYSAVTRSYSAVNFTDILNQLAASDVVDDLFAYQAFIESLADKAEEVNEYVVDIKSKKKTEVDFNDYYKLFDASLDLLGQASSFVDLPYTGIDAKTKAEIKNTTGTLIYVAKSAGDLYVDVRTKNYSSAVQSAIAVLDSLQVGSSDLRKRLLTYGSFVAAVAEAQNSDDVEKAIEGIALPAGSYTIKQHSSFNISVQSYVGYGFDLNHGMSSGLYAPVGIAFSKGLGKKNWGAMTLFGSIIDVGALVAYRLNTPNDSLKQDVRLESILSPSAQLIYSVPNLPLAICGGWRLTPKLVFSNGQSFQTVAAKNVFNLSVLVDIPIITITNKDK